MHVQQGGLPGAVVQVVDVLGDDEDGAGMGAAEAGEGVVGGVGLDGRVPELLAAGVVEGLDAGRIAGEGLRRGDVLDAHARPEAVGVAEGGEAALAADAGAGEDDDAGAHRAGAIESWRPVWS